ncbi:GNAT family N-acetyltransferase [Christensenella intestinihominis]|uniref:GNAT family N-acetyltransferase n=1 Tax=Christensenella intestinihominis TaxID=1851429 RepID=UPI000836F31F|nr:GNAT family N-acetyltransferase [Christensenella intestinihominis]
MKVEHVTENKKDYLELLLIADEQEEMIDRYLEKGDLYVLFDDGVKGVCVTVTDGDVGEIKNIATAEAARGKGYGRILIDYAADRCKEQGCSTLLVGTGDSPLTVPFYEKCGFVRSHRIENFFTDHYDHPIYEAGIQLKDMVYLKKNL